MNASPSDVKGLLQSRTFAIDEYQRARVVCETTRSRPYENAFPRRRRVGRPPDEFWSRSDCVPASLPSNDRSYVFATAAYCHVQVAQKPRSSLRAACSASA